MARSANIGIYSKNPSLALPKAAVRSEIVERNACATGADFWKVCLMCCSKCSRQTDGGVLLARVGQCAVFPLWLRANS